MDDITDGILTVADDLLKNDGKHFIDMMEQLAERRMQREEETQYLASAGHPPMQAGHNHGAPLDDEDYDDDEDEDYDSQEDDEFEEDEMVCFKQWFSGTIGKRIHTNYFATGCDDGGATNGRRAADVPDIRR